MFSLRPETAPSSRGKDGRAGRPRETEAPQNGLPEELFQLFVLFVRDEGVVFGAAQPDDVRPAAVGRDGVNMVKVDNVGLMTAEEEPAVQPRLHLAERIAGHIAPVVDRIQHGRAVFPLHQQDIVHVDKRHALAVA